MMDTMEWASEQDDYGSRLTVEKVSKILSQHGNETRIKNGMIQGLVIMSGADYDVWEDIAPISDIRHSQVFEWLGY